ncbi:hypothetical protein N7468_000298 [Penicillium chermesinum]|uniref:Uncharacterized protein n=1 Tax=Penicillium chermesinum TaxID=63820 RepID=A0A9W9PK13_9EURO|nr:uncharacterized protein N7468_000298 [Penicillium chermesinum]KAJ5248847.1 hypothetical protein N7468_000298 [Penicillium chermesinum]
MVYPAGIQQPKPKLARSLHHRLLTPPLDIWNLSPEQRQSLQTALLECCWCTLSFMRRCQRDYMYHVIRHQRSQLQLRFDPDAEAQLAHLDPFFTGLSHADRPSNSKGDVIIPSRAPDGSRRKLALWFHRGAVQIRPPREIFIEDDVFRLPCSSAIAPGRIPNKLLREPWTNDKLEFLELLSADFYLPEAEGLRENILAKMIRKRQISPFRRLMRMKFRTAECRVPQGWPVPKLIYPLVRKYGDGPGMGDPFALFLLDERWEDIAEAAKDKLIQYVNVEYG